MEVQKDESKTMDDSRYDAGYDDGGGESSVCIDERKE